MSERFKLVTAAMVILVREDQVLLVRRAGTDYLPGHYTVPGGHLEAEETVLQCAVREAQEEVGVRVAAEDFQLVHLVHRHDWDNRFEIFFEARRWNDEPRIAEASKIDDLGWFSIDALPEKTVPSVRHVLGQWSRRVAYSEFGWD